MVRIINIDTKTRTIRVSNGKDDLEWFTTDTGSHVPLKKGQSKAEAIKEHFGDKKNDTKRVAAKIYSKLADRVGYVSDSDLEKYLDDNEYFNDDVREEIVKTVRKLESQASERHTEKDAPKPTGKQPAKQNKGVEEEYTEDDLLYEEARENIMSKYDGDDIAPNGYRATDFMSPQDYDARQKRIETEIEKEFKRLKTAKQQPAKKKTPDTSNADYFKSTMQETMKKFPRLYEHEQKHLEEYAVSAFSALRNNPGKEKAIVDEILDSYNQHVKRLGMWVDTPTLAKKAFVEKLAEAYK